MEILYLLIPISLLLLGLIVWLLFWAVGSGQFDDLDGPALRILMDNDRSLEGKKKPTKMPAKYISREEN